MCKIVLYENSEGLVDAHLRRPKAAEINLLSRLPTGLGSNPSPNRAGAVATYDTFSRAVRCRNTGKFGMNAPARERAISAGRLAVMSYTFLMGGSAGRQPQKLGQELETDRLAGAVRPINAWMLASCSPSIWMEAYCLTYRCSRVPSVAAHFADSKANGVPSFSDARRRSARRPRTQ